jgi:hypothetical protein
MKDGSDAVSDWPLLNDRQWWTWVSLHHGGGVGMGFSQHSGVVTVADDTSEVAKRLERVLWNDPAWHVWCHADAGYDPALDCARDHRLRLPGILMVRFRHLAPIAPCPRPNVGIARTTRNDKFRVAFLNLTFVSRDCGIGDTNVKSTPLGN